MGTSGNRHNGIYMDICGKGEPIVMIHGIISDSTFFEGGVKYLADHYTVITYDRRGYGKSNTAECPDYTVHAQAEELVSILQAECREPAWIVGNSAGGLVALEAALWHPELIKGMILIEPSLGYEPEERKKLLDWNKELNEYLEAGKIKRALPAFSRVIGSSKSNDNSITLEEMKKTYQNLQAFMFGELNEIQHYLPPIEQLRQLEMPVTIAVTEEGRESIFATSSLTAAEMIGWPVAWFPGNHNVAKEMPEEFSESVHRLLREMDKQTCNE